MKGKILWTDLTVHNAAEISHFYKSVMGWTLSEESMTDYTDYNVHDATGVVVAGICHKKDSNANVPSQWLNYYEVDDFELSIGSCQALGGKVMDGPRKMMGKDFAVIQDPEGAMVAIMSK